MKKFLHLFFGLLMPLSVLFIIASTFYFHLDYDLTKSIRIGVLLGLLVGIIVSFCTAIFILIMRRGEEPKDDILKKFTKKKNSPIQKTEYQITTPKENVSLPSESEHISITPPYQKVLHPSAQKLMLLMNHELTFEIALYAIIEESLGTLKNMDESKGKLHIVAQHEHIELSILPLTKHTTQVLIDGNPDSENIEILIKYLKEKELSFLKY